eukprot:SM000124S25911  [mRNA]  locus=s124:58892:59833:- [translate_table: standard]
MPAADVLTPIAAAAGVADVATRRPGDTIVIAPGAPHEARNVRIDKPLCLVRETQRSTRQPARNRRPPNSWTSPALSAAVLTTLRQRRGGACSWEVARHRTTLSSRARADTKGTPAAVAASQRRRRGCRQRLTAFQLLPIVGRLPVLVLTPPTLERAPLLDRALEFHANARIANLTVRVELGSCLLHRAGRLRVEGCSLICDEHPLEHLSCPIVSTAPAAAAITGGATVSVAAAAVKGSNRAAGAQNGMCVVETRIEGGDSAVLPVGGLVLQQVRVLYARAARIFWFVVARRLPLLPLGAAEELLPVQRLQPRA